MVSLCLCLSSSKRKTTNAGTEVNTLDARETTSGASSPELSSSFSSLASATFDSLYAVIRNNKGTLFEEGLRIAQQYGLSDFAVELQQLQNQRQAAGEGECADDVVNGTKLFYFIYLFTVKSILTVTCLKRSSVLCSHFVFVPLQHILYCNNLS
jgi:hypothetical protein